MSLQPVFWAIALALVAVSVVAIAWPLLRRPDLEAPSEDVATTAVYRDQKRQLDADLASGVITATEHEAAVGELAERLGGELQAAPAPVPRAGVPRLRTAAALVTVAIVPVAAIVLYLGLGAPEALRSAPANAGRPTPQEVVAMVDALAQKMQANPGDPKGWRLLGRSYAALGRFPDAVNAFAQAAQHGGDDADLYADWSEAVALAQNRMSGEPEALARKALEKDAGNIKAKALLATAAYERHDYDTALRMWREVEAELRAAGADPSEAAAAIAEIERAQQGSGAAAPAAAITGRVELAPSLASRMQPGDTLFVYARAPSGPRMPLAILRRSAADLPLTFRLDDTMGMGAGPPLSQAPSVVVEARVSHSGQAIAQPGDLVGRSAEVKPGATDVRVVIDQVVP